jgi:hypothetical protein
MSCCLIFSVGIAGCVPAFLQKKTEIPLEKGSTAKSKLLKPKVSEDSEISSISKNYSRPASATSAPKPDKQESFRSAESKKSKPEDTKFNSDSPLEKGETSGPARRISANNEDSGASSKAHQSDEAESKELFKRHNHAKYLDMIKNKAVDLVNSDKGSNRAEICKDTISDQWSLTFYYVKEKTYKFITYSWDEIDDNWKKSFESNKRTLSSLKKHLRYSSSGKECKVLKKARR